MTQMIIIPKDTWLLSPPQVEQSIGTRRDLPAGAFSGTDSIRIVRKRGWLPGLDPVIYGGEIAANRLSRASNPLNVMPESRRLNNPPIAEAIIDLRMELAPGFDVTGLRAAEGLLVENYDVVGEQHLFVRPVELDVNTEARPGQSALTGYTFRSRDERFVAQFTVEGIVVSQLNGYTTWDDLAAETARLWDAYVRVACPVRVLRAGTRYLNHIQIPQAHGELEEYFTTLPQIPLGVPQIASNFLLRMQLSDGDSPYTVSITQFLDYASELPRMILDIDAFSTETYEMDKGAIWDALASLRELKNRVFFGSVTSKTLELFT